MAEENRVPAAVPPFPGAPRYVTPAPGAVASSCAVVWRQGTPDEHRYAFFDQIEIGRDVEGATLRPGVLLIDDPSISRRHCVIRRDADGRCFARDVSRNGTRLDGRRMVPNIEVQVRPGQALSVGADTQLVLEGVRVATVAPGLSSVRTVGMPGTCVATVLVGDIRDYTVLVRKAPPVALQQSVGRAFEALNRTVTEHGGTVKEYQGDAVLAFWEGGMSGEQAVAACAAALALDRRAREIAADRSTWQLADFSLRMDWALATGPVVLDSFGGAQPTGLSLIGEPVVLAFRLEKFATDLTGSIVTCPVTKGMASRRFVFRDLGLMQAKGFDEADRVFALEGEREGD